MLDFRSANSKRQRAQSTIGAGMAVTANDSHAGLNGSELSSNDMDDTLTRFTEIEHTYLCLCSQIFKQVVFASTSLIGLARAPRSSRDHVIGCRDAQASVAYGQLSLF